MDTSKMSGDSPVEQTDAPDAGEALQTPAETTEQRVRRWVAECLSHGRIARDVEVWNELQAALPDLVKIIEA